MEGFLTVGLKVKAEAPHVNSIDTAWKERELVTDSHPTRMKVPDLYLNIFSATPRVGRRRLWEALFEPGKSWRLGAPHELAGVLSMVLKWSKMRLF